MGIYQQISARLKAFPDGRALGLLRYITNYIDNNSFVCNYSLIFMKPYYIAAMGSPSRIVLLYIFLICFPTVAQLTKNEKLHQEEEYNGNFLRGLAHQVMMMLYYLIFKSYSS